MRADGNTVSLVAKTSYSKPTIAHLYFSVLMKKGINASSYIRIFFIWISLFLFELAMKQAETVGRAFRGK